MRGEADIKLQALINRTANSFFAQQVAVAMRRPVQQQIQRVYLLGEFKPLKKPTNLKPVIGLKDSYVYNVVDSSIFIQSVKPYAVYHDTGTKNLPRRTPWIPRYQKEIKFFVDKDLKTYVHLNLQFGINGRANAPRPAIATSSKIHTAFRRQKGGA